jgi:PhzF family phenazine biosynthesis protein
MLMPINRSSFVALLASVSIARADEERTASTGRPSRSVDVVRTVVFSAGPNGGNPCPVVLSAGLTDAEMQAVARHYGQDTVFLLSPTALNADIQLRYFVPEHEMGISGHATVAAVTVALQTRFVLKSEIRIQTISGIFTAVSREGPEKLLVTLEQSPPSFAQIASAAQVAKALRIAATDVALHVGPIQSVSTSRPKLIVPLSDVDALRKVNPDFEALWNLCDQEAVSGLYPFAIPPGNARSRPRARQFPLRAGFPEDAATGVAAAALAAYLTRYDLRYAAGTHEFQISQGYEMGAPSKIAAITECSKDRITRVAIRGSAEIVSREMLDLHKLNPDQGEE